MSVDKQARIEHIVQKKSSFENQVTRLQQYLQTENANPIVAKVRLESVSGAYKDFVRYMDELITLQGDHPLLSSFLQIENLYFEISASIKTSEQVDLNSSIVNNVSIVERHDTPKLPRIQLAVFDGSHDEWLAFKNKFEVLVHSRTDISNVIKHAQLESALSGDALNKIAEFPPSVENYPKAWTALLDAYDQPRLLVSEHSNAIYNLPVIMKPTVADLSMLIDKTKQHLHMLGQLNVKFPDEIIVHILENRLPSLTRAKWEETLDLKRLPSLEKFYTFMANTISKLRALQRNPAVSQSNDRKRGGGSISQPQTKIIKSNAKVFATASTSSSTRTNSFRCIKCQQQHRLFQCPSFNKLDVSERLDFVKGHHICRNCLTSHSSSCRSQQRCKKCQKFHHTLLHRDVASKQTSIHKVESKDIKSSIPSASSI